MIEVRSAGPATRLASRPLHGRAHLGFSLGGAADPLSFSLANRAVGNTPDAPAFEATFSGPTLALASDVVFAWCGGRWDVTLDDVLVPRGVPTAAHAGQTLRVLRSHTGLRMTLAFSGGVLAAASGVRGGDTIKAGDSFTTGPRTKPPAALSAALLAPLTVIDSTDAAWLVRVTDAPQTDWFTPASREAFVTASFAVTPDVSRRGVHLVGPPLSRIDPAREPLSEGIAPGSIQITHAGDPIALHVDQTTTGGYAKIACVASVDRWLLGQLRPGSRVRFARVSLDDARGAFLSWHRQHTPP